MDITEHIDHTRITYKGEIYSIYNTYPYFIETDKFCIQLREVTDSIEMHGEFKQVILSMNDIIWQYVNKIYNIILELPTLVICKFPNYPYNDCKICEEDSHIYRALSFNHKNYKIILTKHGKNKCVIQLQVHSADFDYTYDLMGVKITNRSFSKESFTNAITTYADTYLTELINLF